MIRDHTTKSSTSNKHHVTNLNRNKRWPPVASRNANLIQDEIRCNRTNDKHNTINNDKIPSLQKWHLELHPIVDNLVLALLVTDWFCSQQWSHRIACRHQSLSKEKQMWISKIGAAALRPVRVGVKKFRRCDFVVAVVVGNSFQQIQRTTSTFWFTTMAFTNQSNTHMSRTEPWFYLHGNNPEKKKKVKWSKDSFWSVPSATGVCCTWQKQMVSLHARPTKFSPVSVEDKRSSGSSGP